MDSIYQLSIRAYKLGIQFAAKKNEKAAKAIEGRKDWRSRMQESLDEGADYIWFHCASLGEFEQGRPLIEGIKKQFPKYKIALTFFSPSGYEVRKDYSQADFVGYLPFDLKQEAADFLEILKPKLAVFVKYEIWPCFFEQMKRRQVPLILVSAIFRKEQRFFKSLGGWFRNSLRVPNHIFVQDESSKSLLASIGIDEVSISGDTRFDRVLDIAENSQPISLVEEFVADRKAVIAGSSWRPDEYVVELIMDKLNDDYCFVIAPHELSEAHLESIALRFGEEAIFYSKAQLGELSKKRVLVLDNMGMLSRVYQKAHYVIIGGAFGAGLHNTLEAAVYGVPLAFGPNHKQFAEARDLLRLGIAITEAKEEPLAKRILMDLSDDTTLRLKSAKAAEYVRSRAGATDKILDYLSAEFLS